MLSFITWTVNPELLHLGVLTVRWYGLMWALGFLIGYAVEERIYKRENMPEGAMDKLFLFMVGFTIVGARVGHCFFYEWDYFSHHLFEVLYIWKGGLSSHGGAFGILLGLFIFSRVIKKNYIWVLDRVVIAVALCGACIRLGNLFNHEIYGDPTSMPWAFSFMLHPLSPATTAFSEPSHPTQIYEALYCLITFAVLMFLYWRTNARNHKGLIFGIFLIGVFLSRYLLEFIKRPQEDFEASMLLNVGQLLSLPFVLLGVFLLVRVLLRWRRRQPEVAVKANAMVAGLCLFFVLVMAAPLLSRVGAAHATPKNAPNLAVKPTMSASQTMDYISKSQFVSDCGVQMHVNANGIYVENKKVTKGVNVIPSVDNGQYYLLAPGVDGGFYHYLLRTYQGGVSVLLNLDDQRGNYGGRQ
jgi:phosphatidylglycerol:prolipoprotein diacylglycerol transferase